ncbi:FAD/NAD-P-binding domain-containing protein [Stereum hirsutum FP-91666 SS1]|uniref:FAD/NAD-P-binding domain-containing protein n=1 Tax=Stereum hirsutum (strain FP-91666) TaxID=721885 RepID=UPI000440E9B5|nr:FAD/NAD-P-binding domain-containing protein [Stereum hirsutum FP-91666 SS1]EIM90613.1 FAD/NAD-P-binding domain-containing protein [Stereum hirsutum FP-91666 SS1]
MAHRDNHQPIKIAVVGGGVGGIITSYALASAFSLLQADIEIHVFEAASEFTEIGAGIGVTWRAWTVLQLLGLQDDLLKLIPRAPNDDMAIASRCRKSDQNVGIDILDMMTRGGYTTFLRRDFHAAILSRLENDPNCFTHTYKRLLSYTEHKSESEASVGITLNFADATKVTCDILIGADGLKSVVRHCMYESLALMAEPRALDQALRFDGKERQKRQALLSLKMPVWSGVLVYRALVSAETLLTVNGGHPVAVRVMQYFGRNQHITAYPVSSGRLINIVIFFADYSREFTSYPEPWVEKDVDPQPIIDAFAHWEQEVKELVACIKSTQVSRWAVHVVTDLPSFTSPSSQITLLGDAAHAMTPFQGVGAGQAIEDAYVLSTLIERSLLNTSASTTSATATGIYPSPHITPSRSELLARVHKALQVYSEYRLPIVYDIQERSRRAGMQHAFHSSALRRRNGESSENPGCTSLEWDLGQLAKDLQSNIDWVSEGSPRTELERAVEMLEERLG